MSLLFAPLALRDVTVRNRIFLAPMCQYSVFAADGVPTDWHLVHLGARATGGFGLILTEATAVVPEGRISPQDTGLWNDEQTAAWARIVAFLHQQGAAAGVQLAHAGRKASTYSPFAKGTGTVPPEDGGWATVAPSAIAFGDYAEPAAMSLQQIDELVIAFAESAIRADRAGFDVIEIHAAHGYLIHQFLSPLSNQRTDGYGGDFHGRLRLLREIVVAIREVWPAEKALFIRFSGTDWTTGGWDASDTTLAATTLGPLGVDLFDISSGGNVLGANIPVGPGYQVPLAEQVRHGAGVLTGAVGLITEPAQAEHILAHGSADVVLLARAALRDAAWPLRAAHEFGIPVDLSPYPPQYLRGAWAD